MEIQVPILAGSLLVIWLLYRAFIFWASVPSTANNEISEPPYIRSCIPYIGHLIGIASMGSNLYISSLCAAQPTVISTLRLPGQDMHFIHPLDAPSIKQFTDMPFMSLMAVFRVAVGSCMGLVPASKNLLSDPDTGVFKKSLSKIFNDELRSLQNLQRNASLLDLKTGEHWDKTIKGQYPVTVGLGSWLFDVLSYSMGAVFWGEEGPFEDRLFREHLRVFIQNLETFRSPISFLVPTKLFSAREYVRKKLDDAAEAESYSSNFQETTLFKRLSVLYETLELQRSGFTDCHLVAIVGLMSNVINIVTWAICHIVADPELMASLIAELSAVTDPLHRLQDRETLFVDIDRVRSSCPLLLATWYELLRVYGDSPVARYVYEESVFNNKYQIKKGAIIMTPIHLHNYAANVWGLDVEVFRPSRFLRDNGEVDDDLVKNLNVFGLPGMHQCPGRYLSLNITLSLVIKALLSFEMKPQDEDALGKGVVPKRKETMLGLPAIGHDPEIVVKRREGIESVRLGFET